MRIRFTSAVVLTATALLLAARVDAATIGAWTGSTRTWNSSEMSTVRASMIAAGHTVEADEAISAGNLANDNVFLIGEPGLTPTGAELAALLSWVNGGGILLLFADSGDTGLPALNNITAGLGSSLNWSGSAGGANPVLLGGNFATTGGPFNIVGQFLETSPGTAVHGGTDLAGDFIRYQALGLGYVFAFADRSDHNVFTPDNTTANGQLFLNLAVGGQPAGPAVPEPVSLVLTGMGLSGLMVRRLRRT